MPEESSNETRLVRIENKLDNLATAFIQLAKVEEKLINIDKDRERAEEKFDSLEKQLKSVDDKAQKTLATTTVINRIFWILFTTIVAGGIGFLFSGVV